MKKLMLRSTILALVVMQVLAAPLGPSTEKVDTFATSDFDKDFEIKVKSSALGAYAESGLDAPEIYIASPFLQNPCTVSDGVNYDDGTCRAFTGTTLGTDSADATGILDNNKMYLGSIDPFNKDIATLADSLAVSEQASIDCSVIKNEAGDWDNHNFSQGISELIPTLFKSQSDSGAGIGGNEQGFDCRIAKDASGVVKVRLRGLAAIRILAKNLPNTQVSIENGDLDLGGQGVIASGVHKVVDMRLVNPGSYDPATSGDGVSDGSQVTSVQVSSLHDVFNHFSDQLLLIDFEYDLETLKASANGQLEVGGNGGSSDFAVGELEIAYSFTSI